MVSLQHVTLWFKNSPAFCRKISRWIDGVIKQKGRVRSLVGFPDLSPTSHDLTEGSVVKETVGLLPFHYEDVVVNWSNRAVVLKLVCAYINSLFIDCRICFGYKYEYAGINCCLATAAVNGRRQMSSGRTDTRKKSLTNQSVLEWERWVGA